jgi:hypothetical protein
MAAAEMGRSSPLGWNAIPMPGSSRGEYGDKAARLPHVRKIRTTPSNEKLSPRFRQVRLVIRDVLPWVHLPDRFNETDVTARLTELESTPQRSERLAKAFATFDAINEAQREFTAEMRPNGKLGAAKDWLLTEFKKDASSERLREQTREIQLGYVSAAVASGTLDGSIAMTLIDSYSWEELVRRVVLETILPRALEAAEAANDRRSLNAAAVGFRRELQALMGPADVMYLWRERLVLWMETNNAESSEQIYALRHWNRIPGNPEAFRQVAEDLEASLESVQRSISILPSEVRQRLTRFLAKDSVAEAYSREFFQACFRTEAGSA